MHRKFFDHVCYSNGLGFCPVCKAQGARLASPITANVKALGKVSAFLSERRSLTRSLLYLAARLDSLGLDSLARKAEALAPVASAAHDAATLATVSAKAEPWDRQADAMIEARERRNKRAAAQAVKASEAKRAEKAKREAILSDKAKRYTVMVIFAGESREVAIGLKTDTAERTVVNALTGKPFGKGWQESRAAVKVQAQKGRSLTGIEADNIARGVARKLDTGAPKKAGPRRRRRNGRRRA